MTHIPLTTGSQLLLKALRASCYLLEFILNRLNSPMCQEPVKEILWRMKISQGNKYLSISYVPDTVENSFERKKNPHTYVVLSSWSLLCTKKKMLSNHN